MLKARKSLNERYDFKKLNKIARKIELFMNDHCNGECKELLKVIEKKRNPKYILSK